MNMTAVSATFSTPNGSDGKKDEHDSCPRHFFLKMCLRQLSCSSFSPSHPFLVKKVAGTAVMFIMFIFFPQLGQIWPHSPQKDEHDEHDVSKKWLGQLLCSSCSFFPQLGQIWPHSPQEDEHDEHDEHDSCFSHFFEKQR